MNRYDVIDLISETARMHGVHAEVTETVRTVMCTVKSVRQSEYYTALNSGIQPEYVFALALAEDYQDEKYLRYHGQKYHVVRSYRTEDDSIELTAERSDISGED